MIYTISSGQLFKAFACLVLRLVVFPSGVEAPAGKWQSEECVSQKCRRKHVMCDPHACFLDLVQREIKIMLFGESQTGLQPFLPLRDNKTSKDLQEGIFSFFFFFFTKLLLQSVPTSEPPDRL